MEIETGDESLHREKCKDAMILELIDARIDFSHVEGVYKITKAKKNFFFGLLHLV